MPDYPPSTSVFDVDELHRIGVQSLTRTERLAIAGLDLRDGRVVYDTDWDQLLIYRAVVSRWEFVGNAISISVGSLLNTPSGLLNTTDIYVGLTVRNDSTADPSRHREWVCTDVSPVTWMMCAGETSLGLILSRSTTQSMTNNALTTITWPTEVSDADNVYTPTSGSVFPVINGAGAAGLYVVTARATLASVQANRAYGRITVDHSGGSIDDHDAVFTSSDAFSCTVVTRLATIDDFISVKVFQSSGAAVNVTSALLHIYRIAP